MSNISIEIKISPGTTSNKLSVNLRFVFNSVVCIVKPGGCAFTLTQYKIAVS